MTSTDAVGQELQRLSNLPPDLEDVLGRGGDTPHFFAAAEIARETLWIEMRDGVRLATDIYLPPELPAPSIAMRTPYGRASDKYARVFVAFARRGYVVVSQDCRGTGDSEPQNWDYYMYEPDDGYDLVEWITCQKWFDGFLAACGGSYAGQTQWCMASHPGMSAIAPEVSGLGIAVNTARLHMFLNSYARSVGKGANKVSIPHAQLEHLMVRETLAGGYFNEPLHLPLSEAVLSRNPELRGLPPLLAKRRLWEQYCSSSCSQRAAFVRESLGVRSVSIVEVECLPAIFGHSISHDSHTLPNIDQTALCRSIHAPPLMITGWYDWGLNDALATWQMLRRHGSESVRDRCRLFIAPSAHNAPGYHEGMEDHPELQRAYRTENNVGLLLSWYAAVREGRTQTWPTVMYYLMGANEWRVASDWPPPEVEFADFYLGSNGTLTRTAIAKPALPDSYVYDPENPTPTVGGSILSNVYRPGSVDVSQVQQRADVLTYTTVPLTTPVDVVGPLRLVLFASSSAVDTDFSARLTDVFPDGRAIQLQSGMLRARYRDLTGSPQLLEPRRIYQLEIDLWATANRFAAGHRIRLDISSADFPRFDRNTNRGGVAGPPVAATQNVFHDPKFPSRLVLPVLSA